MESWVGLVVLSCAAAFACTPASAAKLFRGPVEAIVVEVLDGDTFLAEAFVWPGHTVRVNVRIRGIDAPEMKARCDAERAAALKAREALASLFGEGSGRHLEHIGRQILRPRARRRHHRRRKCGGLGLAWRKTGASL